MIFRQEFLEGIQKGVVTVAFRRWRRPSVKAGGTLLTAIGLLHIRDVSLVTMESISNADARRAGYESREALVTELTQRSDGKLYRIELGALAADLCKMADQDKVSFKMNVRKLKTLGLTESLEVGYRLSPRGSALLDELRRRE